MNLLTHFRGWLEKVSNRQIASLALLTVAVAQGSASYGADHIVNVGANVTLHAAADGAPAPTFSWLKNGTPIAGATNSTLSIVGATLADAAAYRVIASNEFGSAESHEQVIVVQMTSPGTPPSIATQPAPSQSIVAGGPASVSVVAAGNPAPTYQWYKNGVPILNATKASIDWTVTTSHDAATYYVVVSNGAGTATSNSSLLTVTEPPPQNVAPSITKQPVAQSVTVGGSVTFTVTATGTPAPTFQWWKNNVAIPGATSSTFTIMNVTVSDSASYHAVASNVGGDSSSTAVPLTVSEPVVVAPPPPPQPQPQQPQSAPNAAPLIVEHPAATQTVTAGSTVSLSVAATGQPAPTYQWRRNGVNMVGATNSTLTLRSATAADAATYSVIVSNSMGKVVSNNASVAVNMAPTISVQPLPVSAIAGSNAKFTVVVSAIPGAKLQWHKNGVAIAGATNALLSINGVSSKDQASYSVVATNSVGTVTSKSVSLTIAVPPTFTKQPGGKVVATKSNVTFSALATGSPEPKYQWKRNGVAISGATASTLVLKAVNELDAGKYTVDAINSAGWVASSTATLYVVNVGKAPTDSENDDLESFPEFAQEGAGSGNSRLVNLSVRAMAGNDAAGLIVGFVIGGANTKPVLVRGVGPSLREFGVTDALSDPKLSLYKGANVAASNDDWMANENAALIAGTSARVGAFKLPDSGSDAALLSTLSAGAYTAQLSAKDASGVALVEVYDAAASNGANLVNLSVRAQIGSGSEAPNVGFVISGTTPKRVLIRVVGPTLAAFGVTDVIADPQIELYQGTTRIDHNDNWGGSAALSETFAKVGAFGFEDASSSDAVLLATLAPGSYTVVASGANGTTGVGLVELYEVP